MPDPSFMDKVLTAFKEYPIAMALLIIVYWLFRLLHATDKSKNEMLRLFQVDTDRQMRLITLMEILLGRKKE